MPKKILMVEDDAEVKESIKELIEIKFDDCIVDLASDGLEGIEKIKQLKSTDENYALIITDYKMPTMDGVSFLIQAYALLKEELPQCLFVSGFFQSNIETKFEADLRRYITMMQKPIVSGDLVRVMQEKLDRKA